jgi:hypothetical protein
MEFFSEFSWAVPTIFSDAIADCKFEEGDILYDSQSAYQKWQSAVRSLEFCIKVKFPRRSLRVTKGKSESVALANWNSEVKIELKEFANDKPIERIVTTQGKLFYLLWKGNLKILNNDAPDPPPPLFLKDVKKKLVEVVVKCEKIAAGKSYFIMAHDPTNKVSIQKNIDILSVLNTDFGCDLIQLPAKKAGFISWEKVSPVICINLYVIDKGEHSDIFTSLKKVLYKPLNNKKKDSFRISAHGILGQKKFRM